MDYEKEPAIAVQDVFSKPVNVNFGLEFFKKMNPSNDIRQVAMGAKPDPTKFTIKSIEHVHGNTIVLANYGGETFGGDKLMVLRGIHTEFQTLDPHFLDESYPVFARFQPTPEGFKLARMAASFQTVEFVIPEGYKVAYDHFDEQIVQLITAKHLFSSRHKDDQALIIKMMSTLDETQDQLLESQKTNSW